MSINEIFNMYFGIIEDERCEVNVKHPLVNILKLVLIAVLCGMDELDKIIDYGKNKKDFLEREFDIKGGCWKSSWRLAQKNSELENNFFNSLFFML